MNIGGLCRFLYLIDIGLGYGVSDIFRDGPIEKERILKHGRYVLTKALYSHIIQIMTVYHDLSGCRLIEPRDQLCECRFSDSRRAHESEHLTGRTHERYIVQDHAAGLIRKAHMIKSYLSLHIRKRPGTLFVGYLTRCIEHSHHTLRSGQRLLHVFQKICKSGDRSIKEPEVKKECDHILNFQAVLPRKISAESHDQYRSERRYELNRGMEYPAYLKSLEHGLDMFEITYIDLLGLILFTPE